MKDFTPRPLSLIGGGAYDDVLGLFVRISHMRLNI